MTDYRIVGYYVKSLLSSIVLFVLKILLSDTIIKQYFLFIHIYHDSIYIVVCTLSLFFSDLWIFAALVYFVY